MRAHIGRAFVTLMLAGAGFAGLGGLATAAARDARAAVEAFVAQLGGIELHDLVIQQTFILYHRDGIHPGSRGEQRLVIKLPGRHRLEQTIDGQHEVRLSLAGRLWIRRVDGTTYEAPSDAERDPTKLLVPFQRSAADLLSEWRALGVRDDLTHEARVGARVVTVIGARPGDRESPMVWLDPEYGVVRFVTRERLPEGGGLVDLTFSEHRLLAGHAYFPYRQEAFADGKLIVLITVRSVIANSNPSDQLFDPDALRRER
jgi:hypothetical protein